MALFECVRTFTIRCVLIGNIACRTKQKVSGSYDKKNLLIITVFVVGKLSKASQLYVFLLAVLSTVRYDLIGVGANVVALEAMKMRRLIVRSEILIVSAILITAVHVRPELFEIVAHQLIEALVAGCVLNETCLVAERVKAIFSTAMEMGLMIAISAVGKVAILIKSKL